MTGAGSPAPDRAALPHAGEIDLITYVDGLEIIAVRALGDPDDAHDAVQETLARAWSVIRSGQADRYPTLALLVYGIARHVIADIQRRRRRTLGLGDDAEHVPAAAPGALEQLVRAEERQRVRHAVARLSTSEQDLLRRCYVDGVRLTEIAHELGLPAERVRKRKSRALERLRALLGVPERHEDERPPIME